MESSWRKRIRVEMASMVTLGLLICLIVINYRCSNGYLVGNRLVTNKITTIVKPLQSNEIKLSLFKKRWNPNMIVQHNKKPDFLAFFSYIGATLVQWSMIFAFLHFLQIKVINKLPLFFPTLNSDTLSTGIVFIFMFFMSLKSRVFSPLNNSRPKASNDDPVFKNLARPSWQPPPKAFPIIWITIAFLRTISTTLVFQHDKTLLSLPISLMFLHLSIGDTWNTINNVERRLGTSAAVVFFVLLSIIATTYLYFTTLPLAGYILAPSVVWLTIATLLVNTIYRMNYLIANKPTIFPSIEEGPPSSWTFGIIGAPVAYIIKKIKK